MGDLTRRGVRRFPFLKSFNKKTKVDRIYLDLLVTQTRAGNKTRLEGRTLHFFLFLYEIYQENESRRIHLQLGLVDQTKAYNNIGISPINKFWQT